MNGIFYESRVDNYKDSVLAFMRMTAFIKTA